MSQKRIEFIDLAKGVCMIALVLGHCGIRINLPGLEIVRMPLYFILSGLFFKDYGGGYNFFIRKTNKILIPFIFFYLLGCMAYYGIKFLAPQLLITSAGGILDVFNSLIKWNYVSKLKESRLCNHVDSVGTETNLNCNIYSVDCVEVDFVFSDISLHISRKLFFKFFW